MTYKEAYPKERMTEIEAHLRKVWSGEVNSTYSCISTRPNYRQLEDEKNIVDLAVENILLNSKYPGYNPPRLIVDYGTVSTAAYWGGTVHLPVGGCLSIEPIIKSTNDLADIHCNAFEEGDGQRGINLYNQVCKKLDTSDLYCSTFDFQGPLTTAALLWEQTDFMVSMYTEPEIVHSFLDHVTTKLIEIIKKYIAGTNNKVCANVWPYIWLPTDIGIGITEDYMPLLSKEMYKEFGIPYVERISKEFGGVFIHCCGEYEHQIENLKNSEINILGLEFHYPHTRPEVLFEAFGSKALFVPYIAPKGAETFKNNTEYFLYLKSIMKQDTRLWFILNPDSDEFNNELEIVEDIIGIQ